MKRTVEVCRKGGALMIVTGNCVLDKMLELEGPLTVERYVELAYMGSKTLADIQGEEWCEIWDFQEIVRELAGEQEGE